MDSCECRYDIVFECVFGVDVPEDHVEDPCAEKPGDTAEERDIKYIVARKPDLSSSLCAVNDCKNKTGGNYYRVPEYLESEQVKRDAVHIYLTGEQIRELHASVVDVVHVCIPFFCLYQRSSGSITERLLLSVSSASSAFITSS